MAFPAFCDPLLPVSSVEESASVAVAVAPASELPAEACAGPVAPEAPGDSFPGEFPDAPAALPEDDCSAEAPGDSSQAQARADDWVDWADNSLAAGFVPRAAPDDWAAAAVLLGDSRLARAAGFPVQRAVPGDWQELPAGRDALPSRDSDDQWWASPVFPAALAGLQVVRRQQPDGWPVTRSSPRAVLDGQTVPVVVWQTVPAPEAVPSSRSPALA